MDDEPRKRRRIVVDDDEDENASERGSNPDEDINSQPSSEDELGEDLEEHWLE